MLADSADEEPRHRGLSFRVLAHRSWQPEQTCGRGLAAWIPRERQKLFTMVDETGADGVAFLSGDRHIGALYRQAGDVSSSLYEITSSGINRAYLNADEPGLLRLGDVYRHENFGSIDIDWPKRHCDPRGARQEWAACSSSCDLVSEAATLMRLDEMGKARDDDIKRDGQTLKCLAKWPSGLLMESVIHGHHC